MFLSKKIISLCSESLYAPISSLDNILELDRLRDEQDRLELDLLRSIVSCLKGVETGITRKDLFARINNSRISFFPTIVKLQYNMGRMIDLEGDPVTAELIMYSPPGTGVCRSVACQVTSALKLLGFEARLSYLKNDHQFFHYWTDLYLESEDEWVSIDFTAGQFFIEYDRKLVVLSKEKYYETLVRRKMEIELND